MDEVERQKEFARISRQRFKHSTRCADLETHPPTAAGDGRRYFFLATHRAKSFASALALMRNLAQARTCTSLVESDRKVRDNQPRRSSRLT